MFPLQTSFVLTATNPGETADKTNVDAETAQQTARSDETAQKQQQIETDEQVAASIEQQQQIERDEEMAAKIQEDQDVFQALRESLKSNSHLETNVSNISSNVVLLLYIILFNYLIAHFQRGFMYLPSVVTELQRDFATVISPADYTMPNMQQVKDCLDLLDSSIYGTYKVKLPFYNH